MDDSVKHAKTVNASETDSGVQKMVFGISHDMSAPLRSVVQFSQLLKNRVGDKLDEKEIYWLQLIEEGGIQAQKMIDALLCYSRLSTNRQPDTTFQLNKPLEDTIATLDGLIQQQSASINFEGEWPEYTGCEEHMALFFNYLIHNALLYQPKEKDHKPLINISCTQTNGKLQIRIEDNGIGVQETLHSAITTPFKRMQSNADYAGIGMGLTYCERISELNGASMKIEKSSLGGLAVVYTE